MANHDDGIRSMDDMKFGDSSVANQGNVGVLHHDSIRFHADPSANQNNYHANSQTNTHNYYGTPTPGTPPVQACVRVGLPPRNANRVERERLFGELEQMLPRGEEHYPVALWGLPGSGKTQLALHYAHQRFDPKKCSVFWVPAKDENTFVNNFRKISRKAGFGMFTDDQEMLLSVREWIESQPTWVMVIDGADDVELFTRNNSDRVQLRDFIPDGPNGTVIWTSQDRGILEAVGWNRSLEVGSMNPDEAVSLLEFVANHGQPFNCLEAARMLVRELGHSPLIVFHVARTMRAGFTPKNMLSRLSDPHEREGIFEAPRVEPRTPQEVRRSILGLLTGQVERLASHDPDAYRIIAMIAYMDRHAIPLGIFLGVSGHKEDGLIRRAIVRLKDLSLVHDNPADVKSSTYNADELMQEAIRYHLTQKAALDDVSKISGGVRGQANSSDPVCFRGQAVAALSRRFPRTIHYDTLDLCKSLVEHIVKVSQWAGSQCDVLDETADLLIQAGDYLLFSGRWREMIVPYQRALEFRRKSLGAGDPRTIAAMDSLAHAQMKLGDYRLALKLFTEAYKLRIERLGLPETNPDVITSNMNIGVAHRILGHLNLAEKLLTRSLALRIEIMGADDLDSAQSMYELAQLYYTQLYDSKSVRNKQTELLTKCLSIQKRNLGDEHPKTLETKLHLGGHLDLMGDITEGRRLHDEVLESQQRFLSNLHPFTLEIKRCMSITIYSIVDQQKAFQTISEIAADSEATLGRSNPLTLRALGDLARELSIREDYDAAADIQKESLNVYSHQLGKTHFVTVCVQLDLASLYLSQGRVRDCKTLARAAEHALYSGVRTGMNYGAGAQAALNRARNLRSPTKQGGVVDLDLGEALLFE